MGYAFDTDIRNVLNDYTSGLDLNVNSDVAQMIKFVIEKSDSLNLVENHSGLSRIDLVSMPRSKLLEFTVEIIENKSMIFHAVVLCLMILLFFVFCGFIISLFYETPREYILSKENFLNGFSALAIFVLMLTAAVQVVSRKV